MSNARILLRVLLVVVLSTCSSSFSFSATVPTFLQSSAIDLNNDTTGKNNKRFGKQLRQLKRDANKLRRRKSAPIQFFAQQFYRTEDWQYQQPQREQRRKRQQQRRTSSNHHTNKENNNSRITLSRMLSVLITPLKSILSKFFFSSKLLFTKNR